MQTADISPPSALHHPLHPRPSSNTLTAPLLHPLTYPRPPPMPRRGVGSWRCRGKIFVVSSCPALILVILLPPFSCIVHLGCVACVCVCVCVCVRVCVCVCVCVCRLRHVIPVLATITKGSPRRHCLVAVVVGHFCGCGHSGCNAHGPGVGVRH